MCLQFFNDIIYQVVKSQIVFAKNNNNQKCSFSTLATLYKNKADLKDFYSYQNELIYSSPKNNRICDNTIKSTVALIIYSRKLTTFIAKL